MILDRVAERNFIVCVFAVNTLITPILDEIAAIGLVGRAFAVIIDGRRVAFCATVVAIERGGDVAPFCGLEATLLRCCWRRRRRAGSWTAAWRANNRAKFRRCSTNIRAASRVAIWVYEPRCWRAHV